MEVNKLHKMQEGKTYVFNDNTFFEARTQMEVELSAEPIR